MIDKTEECFLIADDSVLSKIHSKNIDLVNYQYSGNAHDVIAGIGLINLRWHGCKQQESIPVDYRIYILMVKQKTHTFATC